MTLHQLGKLMVMVADDEPIIIELIEAILSREGYTVLSASTADQALELGRAYRGQISLALLDYSLRDESGKLVAFLNGHSEIRVVLMSGYNEMNVRNCGLPYQRYEFLQKPFTREIMMAVMHKSLGTPPCTERAGDDNSASGQSNEMGARRAV